MMRRSARLPLLLALLAAPSSVLAQAHRHRPQARGLHRGGQVPQAQRLLQPGGQARALARVLPPGDAAAPTGTTWR